MTTIKEFELDMDVEPNDHTGVEVVKMAIAAHLRDAIADSGVSVASVCRKAGISRQAYYYMFNQKECAVLHFVSKADNRVLLGNVVVRVARALGVKIKVYVSRSNGTCYAITSDPEGE